MDSKTCEFAIAYMLCSRFKDVKGLHFRVGFKTSCRFPIVQQCRNAGGILRSPYIYLCVYTYIYIYVQVCVCMYMIYVYTHINISIYICICIYANMHICIYYRDIERQGGDTER